MIDMNNYTDSRMNLDDICNWLNSRNYNDIADIIKDKLINHIWTKNNMIRTDVIKDIYECVYGTDDLFIAMEDDVVTHTNVIPFSEAHID